MERKNLRGDIYYATQTCYRLGKKAECTCNLFISNDASATSTASTVIVAPITSRIHTVPN